MQSMAHRDLVSNQELLNYLKETHDLFVYYLEIYYSDAIEGFLSEYNEEFLEYCENELGMEIRR